jgi:hypothetical protein
MTLERYDPGLQSFKTSDHHVDFTHNTSFDIDISDISIYNA